MKIKLNKRHFHSCYQCKSRVSCYFIHNKFKTDLIGTLCDQCTRRIVKNLHEVNV